MSVRPLLVFGLFLIGCGGAPANIEFVSVEPAHPRIGEIATVTFKLLDYRSQPQAGASVAFRIQGNSPGVVITPLKATSEKGSGTVQTTVQTTGAVTSFVVVADAGGKIALSPPISVAGTVANQAQLTFQCGPIAGTASGGIHNITAYNPARDLIAGVKLKCSAHVGDRNGDGVPDALVSFLTEAGTIGPTETSKTDVIGNATILYKTSLPLPVETAPDIFNWTPNTDEFHTGEYLVPLWMEPNSWTKNPLATLLIGMPVYNATRLEEPRRTDPVRVLPGGGKPLNNPRDNLVAMIAVTAGEEAFVDLDNNGTQNGDEPYIDLPEPFVDSNDNGTHDADEKYVDTDGSGDWTGKNGKWDPNTLIWRQERILWSGIPFGAILPGQPDDYTGAEPTVDAARPLGTSLIRCGGLVNFAAAVSDPWFNSMARNADGDTCRKVGSTKNVDVPPVSAGTGIAFTYPAIQRVAFSVIDNLERMPMPMTNPPSPGCYAPPYSQAAPYGSGVQDWAAVVQCDYTASPEEGFVTGLAFGAQGTIINNLPSVPP